MAAVCAVGASTRMPARSAAVCTAVKQASSCLDSHAMQDLCSALHCQQSAEPISRVSFELAF